MRHPVMDEEADVRVMEKVLSLEGLRICSHNNGRIWWQRGGGV